MRKALYIILLACSLAGTGCHSQIDNELAALDRRLAALEKKSELINANIESLHAVVNKIGEFDFIKSITTIRENYETVGYTISFTHSSPISIYLGKDAQTPTIGVKKGMDGTYYWCIRYPSGREEMITNNYGQNVPASAQSPIVKIENGYWMVTYDNGEIWHNVGKATGTTATSFFESVEDSVDYVKFNLLDGSSVRVPTWSTFEKLKESVTKNNSNLESLKELINGLSKFTYARDFTPIVNGNDTLGFRLNMSDGRQLPFYHGTATNLPVISAKKVNPNDSEYYWTVKYSDKTNSEWLLVNGQRVRANALENITPIIGFEKHIDNIYYWTVSYDNGKNYDWILHDGARVRASGITHLATITSLTESRGNTFELTIGGNTVVIPRYEEIIITVTPSSSVVMAANATQTLTYTLNRGDERTEVAALTNDGFYARIEKVDNTSGKIIITAPFTFVAGSESILTLVVADGNGNVKTVDITIQNS